MTTESVRRADRVDPYFVSEVVNGLKIAPEEVKERVRAIFSEWQPLLFLNAYTIGVSYQGENEAARDGSDDRVNRVASVRIGHPYLHLSVMIFPEFWEWNNAEEQEQILVHELAHTIVEDMHNLVLDGQAGRLVSGINREAARERATDWIANVAWYLRDHARSVEKALEEEKSHHGGKVATNDGA